MEHSERFEELAALEALGLPLGEESAPFARHLQDGCVTCEQLLLDFREASTALASATQSRRPSPDVRRWILASLDVSPPARVSSRARRPARAWLALAAVLLLVAVVTDDLRLRRQHEELRSRSAELSGDLDSARTTLARESLRARILASDDVKVRLLAGKDPQPDAWGKVFWSERVKRGILVAGNLAPLTRGEQYELWVFAQGKPVPAGVFGADRRGGAFLESSDLARIASAEKFAVTIEPRGGVPQPTGPVVLLGG